MRVFLSLVFCVVFLISLSPPIVGTPPSKESLYVALSRGISFLLSPLARNQSGSSTCDFHYLDGRFEPYEPAWHTGQQILALVEASSLLPPDGDGGRWESLRLAALSAAERSGQWWSSLLSPSGLFLSQCIGCFPPPTDRQLAVVATYSDGAPGLFALSTAVGNASYADAATTGGQWILRHMRIPQDQFGYQGFYDCVNISTHHVLHHSSPFCPECSIDQLPFVVARPNLEGAWLFSMGNHTGNSSYIDAGMQVALSMVDHQSPNGAWMKWLPNNASTGYVHGRFNTWYAEALLDAVPYARNEQERIRLIKSAMKTAVLLESFVQPNGNFYYKNFVSGKKDKDSICGSCAAFAGHLMLRLQNLHGDRALFQRTIDRISTWLLANVMTSPSSLLPNATLETRTRYDQDTEGVRVDMYMRGDLATSFAMRFFAAQLKANAW